MPTRFAQSDESRHGQGFALPDRLRILADTLRSALWPVPLAMLGLALATWAAAGWLDSVLPPSGVLQWSWLRSGSGDDARNLLSTLLTAIITMSSIVFSITIVTLTLAANQFGSRLVRTYMSDLRTKLALGLFVMTVMYCLMALRVVEQGMTKEQVPHVTVTVGLLLAAACVLVLVLFLHNVARSIVADEVIRRVGAELEDAIASLPPGARPCEAAADPFLRTGGALLRARSEGYVQAVHYRPLVAAAAEDDVQIDLMFRPGVFMCRDGWLARVHPAARMSGRLEQAIQRCVLIGGSRTPTQDLDYSMRHLIDVALRALSPSVNDPNTAMVVIDRLRAALSTVMGRQLPPAVHADGDGRPRVSAPCHSYADLLDYAFAQIRRAGAGQPVVVLRLLSSMARIAEHALLDEQFEALRTQARLAAEVACARELPASDLQLIRQSLDSALGRIDLAAGQRTDTPVCAAG